jgi:hypothetical protein
MLVLYEFDGERRIEAHEVDLEAYFKTSADRDETTEKLEKIREELEKVRKALERKLA